MWKYLSNLEDHHHSGLLVKSEQTGEPISVHVRKAVEFYLSSGLPSVVIMIKGDQVISGTISLGR